MAKHQVFRTPAGFDRALGRDTVRTRKNWDKLISDVSTAPHIMAGAPEESPYIRRFHHKSFLSQRQKGYCFPAETLITLENKGRAFISDIKVGREVLSHNNQKHKVTEVFERRYTGPMYLVSIKGLESLLRLTEEHPIGTVNSPRHQEVIWKAACYLKPGDLVLRPYGDQAPENSKDYHRHKYGTLHPVMAVTTQAVMNLPVHNFEVESIHTYIANECASHNCCDLR